MGSTVTVQFSELLKCWQLLKAVTYCCVRVRVRYTCATVAQQVAVCQDGVLLISTAAAAVTTGCHRLRLSAGPACSCQLPQPGFGHCTARHMTCTLKTAGTARFVGREPTATPAAEFFYCLQSLQLVNS
jgi:hypothetical protein